jgi:molecular chaperone Hsp31 and glyoxalase 3
MADSTEYAAIFIPGGHGAMLGLPEDKNLGALLRWGHDNDLFTLAICHGPAALLAADLNSPDSSDEGNSKRDFIFKGYKMVAFPTIMDKQMPKIGYLPGTMPWYFGEKLENLGVTIDNKLVSGQTHQDRKLISGDGPLAANDFGKMSAKALLKEFG